MTHIQRIRKRFQISRTHIGDGGLTEFDTHSILKISEKQ